MYKLKEFADFFGINANTLRFYDKHNLFSPEYKDDITGYRYYTQDQYLDMISIIELRKIGFSIEEIKLYLNGKLDFKEMKLNLLDKIKAAEYMIDTISLIDASDDSDLNGIYIRTLPESPTLRIRLINSNIEETVAAIKNINRILPSSIYMYNERMHSFIEYDSPNFNYEGFNATIHAPVVTRPNHVSKPIPLTEYSIDLFQETRCICARHVGSYETLDKTYLKIGEYLKTHNITPSRVIERYIKYSDRDNNTDNLITEVCFPIKS